MRAFFPWPFILLHLKCIAYILANSTNKCIMFLEKLKQYSLDWYLNFLNVEKTAACTWRLWYNLIVGLQTHLLCLLKGLTIYSILLHCAAFACSARCVFISSFFRATFFSFSFPFHFFAKEPTMLAKIAPTNWLYPENNRFLTNRDL